LVEYNPKITDLKGLANLSELRYNKQSLLNPLLIPYVHTWAKKRRMSPSKVLIPLSFSAILGGAITLIGTSTNFVVNALYNSQTGKSLHLWDFTPLGLPATALGILYMVLIGSKLLTKREDREGKNLLKSFPD
jgi:di/tricarboxylate transporter